jgi:serine/threonine-protein kinase
VDLKGPKKIEVLLGNRFNEVSPRLSPDGRWMAWLSTESGKLEVFLSDFPAVHQKWQVSSGTGRFPSPFWNHDGMKIFFGAPDGLSSVALGSAAKPDPGKPTLVIRDDPSRLDLTVPIGTDGQRFLALRFAEAGAPEPLRLIRNWKQTLQE